MTSSVLPDRPTNPSPAPRDDVLLDQLRAVPFFRDLPADSLAAIADRLRLEHHPAGAIVCHEGDRAEAMYLVESGQVDVVDPSMAALATLGAGSFVGEIALLLDEPRSATLRAAVDTRLWALDKADLDAVLIEHPRVGLEMSRELSRRLVATTRKLRAPHVTVVVAVWGDDVGRLARALLGVGVRRLGVGVPAGAPAPPVPEGVAVVDADRVDEASLLGPAGSNIDDLEVALLVLPRTPGSPGRALLERADHVVAFEAPPGWVSGHRGRQLVLRADGADAALQRACRWITGRAVGLALSSGGSKAVAHFGVLRVLRELGVTVDAVAGASGGAVVGAAVAFEVDDTEIDRRLRAMAAMTKFRRFDYNLLPRAALFKGARIRHLFHEWFPDMTFEAAPIPFWVVASDVSTGGEVVIDEGLVADGLRASMSIPGALNPWFLHGRHLIDGAIVNPMPASVLRQAGIRHVIGSNVAGQDLAMPEGRIPHLLQIMGRMINSMEREMVKAQLPLADVVVRPILRASNSFDFSHIDDFIATGERAAREVAPEIEALLARARA